MDFDSCTGAIDNVLEAFETLVCENETKFYSNLKVIAIRIRLILPVCNQLPYF